MSYQAGASPGGAPAAAPIASLGAPPAPKQGRRGCGGCLIAGPASLGLFIPLIALFCPKACAAIEPSHEVAMAELQACHRARDLLGDDLEAAWVGMSSGETSTSGGSGSASWSLTVSGSGGRGEYRYVARKSGGVWQLATATLTAGGTSLRVPADCGAPATATEAGASPFGQSACERMQRCCDAAGNRPPLEGTCRALPAIRSAPTAPQTCAQLLDSAGRLLAAGGDVPDACR